MSNPQIPSSLHRRTVLRLIASTAMGTGLGACGGQTSRSHEEEDVDALRVQANAALSSGLVGLVLGEIRDRSSVSVSVGKRRLGQSAPVEAGDPFAIGSNTKAMTSAAIVALAARGGPALSMTLSQLPPDRFGGMQPAFAQVTLADLLHHRGGLAAFNGSGPEESRFLDSIQADTDPLPDTMKGRREYFVRWLLAQPPVAGVTPGQDFLYSNAGYVAAATLVEVVTGKPFESLFDEALVQPLELTGHWRSPVAQEQDLLWGHEGSAGSLVVARPSPEEVDAKAWLDIRGPAGHWACTGDAYAKWLRWHVLALRGESTPLPDIYVRDLRAAADDRYVWGWQGVATPNRMLLTHTGHVPGFMAEAVLDRAGGFGVFGLSNTGDFAEDGTSWVLRSIGQALADVLKQQQITL